TAGMRCAVNLTGVGREDLRRGDMLSHPGAIEPSHILDATFRYLRTSRAPLPRRSRVLLHHATAQLMATVVLADRDQLMPGDEALVQLRLDATTPLAALPGDRFIARGFVVQEHYGTTIGGGEIVRVHAPKVKRSSAEAAAAIARIADASGDDRVALEVRGAKVAGIDATELGRRLGLSEDELATRLGRLVEASDLACAGEIYMHAESFARLEKTALDLIESFHVDHPEREGLSKEELRGRLPRSLPPRIYELLLETLVRRDAIELARDLVHKKRGQGAGPALGKREQQVLERYRAWGIEAPRLKELPAALGMGDKELRGALDRLLTAGALVRIKSDYYVADETAERLRAALLAHLEAHGQITPAEWKDITAASRKFSIPLAEYFDEQKLTLRIGDIRKRRG
ncbi:MAG TPA: SelB C-terminal domain-containing protein, partial [Kofleriaceae bacterium]|nr:SelB C-terminal domain-containing protein [Kofleriaceae bacterium]